MLCPSCRKLISVDEPRCPFCGAVRPGLWGFGPELQRLFGATLDLVPLILGACIVLYVVGLVLDLPGALRQRGFLSFLSPSGIALYRLGMTGGTTAFGERWWTLITAIYLHGGVLHILFNMWSLRNIGPEAQRVFGPARFFVLFTVTGAAGFVLSNLLGARFSIGASGSIFGLLGALIAFGRRQRTALGDMASRQMLQWAVIMLLFGFMTPSVNNLAHLGGFAAGWIFGKVVPAEHERREGRRMQLLALGLVLLTIYGFVRSLMQPLELVP
jgi:rhomboid protease GluP